MIDHRAQTSYLRLRSAITSRPRVLVLSVAVVASSLAVGLAHASLTSAWTLSSENSSSAKPETRLPVVNVDAKSKSSKKKQPSNLHIALNLARKGKFDQAFGQVKRTGDPAARKIIEWTYVQSDTAKAGFDRIVSFMKSNPDWPRLSTVRKRSELALYLNPKSSAEIIAHFKAFPPQSGLGQAALARAYFAQGDKKKATEWIREAWRKGNLNASAEKNLHKQMGHLIRDKDRRHRLSWMIYARNTRAALRASKYLPKSYQTMAKSAVAFHRRTRRAARQFERVSKNLRSHPALTYARARWHRKKKGYKGYKRARELLVSSSGKHLNPEAVWVEREAVTRLLLERGKTSQHKLAYKLVSNHDLKPGKGFAQAQFMSGWIALSFLKDAKTALRHFKKLRSDATLPRTVAQAEYWLGRANDALSNPGEAKAHYEAAAQLSRTYYGQLARDNLNLPQVANGLSTKPKASEAARTKLNSLDAMKAARLLSKAGEKQLTATFIGALSYHLKTRDERLALAEATWTLGVPHLSLRVARVADRFGQSLGAFLYPTTLVPKYRQLNKAIEAPLLYGLARQESEFNPKAKSRVGARGLMQIMPATGKLIARQHGQRYSLSKLTHDPSFNVTLGATHLRDLITVFNGSYIMTMVAYNAGPRRAIQWSERFGDPRKGQIDPIDWVEAIPFRETRLYVQKVMQNVQVYRSLFASNNKRTLVSDLHLGGVAPAVTGTQCADNKNKTIEVLISCNN